jgi:hypothetical protein
MKKCENTIIKIDFSFKKILKIPKYLKINKNYSTTTTTKMVNNAPRNNSEKFKQKDKC